MREGVKQIAHSLMSTKNRIVIHQLCYICSHMRVIYVEVPFASQKGEKVFLLQEERKKKCGKKGVKVAVACLT